ncbi:MAG: sulfatase [Planctomycetota bacterium]|jgi:arylsulfatase A-like enzyme
MIRPQTLSLLIALTLAPAPASAARPNVVFILADDLGVMDINVEGSVFYETPHIDRLANSGMRFLRGYAACRVCSPSRASVMTGQYTTRHGVTDWIGAKTGLEWNRNDRVLPAEYTHHLPHETTSLAEAFKAAGYRTFFAGKWHLGDTGSDPQDHGFDINKGGFRAGSPPGGYFSPWTNPALENGPKGESLPLRLANETASFIESSKDRPFFAFLSFYSVHGPVQTTQPLWDKYREKAARMAPRDSRFIFDRTKAVRQVQDHPIYAGMMELMDDAVGIVLDRLEELDLDDNTIVVFTSDNGGVSSGDAFATSNLPLRGGKGRQWEGGIREPYYIRAPGVAEPYSLSATPVSGIDFYPTLLELAGIQPDANHVIDGVSLVPLLKGGDIARRDLYWHYPHYGNQGGEPSSIIRSGDWKLIHYYEDGRDELYHIASDVGERRDEAANRPARVKQMRSKLDSWLNDTGARIPQPDSRFDAAHKKEQLANARGAAKDKLENFHANILKPDYQPNKDWWSSQVTKD